MFDYIQAPTPGSVVVKKYDPKAAAAIRKKTEEEQFLISPLTGERISADKAAEHMKVKCVCVRGQGYIFFKILWLWVGR